MSNSYKIPVTAAPEIGLSSPVDMGTIRWNPCYKTCTGRSDLKGIFKGENSRVDSVQFTIIKDEVSCFIQ